MHCFLKKYIVRCTYVCRYAHMHSFEDLSISSFLHLPLCTFSLTASAHLSKLPLDESKERHLLEAVEEQEPLVMTDHLTLKRHKISPKTDVVNKAQHIV